MSSDDFLASDKAEIYQLQSRASGPAGKLPITEDQLRHGPSGDLFGMTQNAGMGWEPTELGRKQFLILSTQGGLRAPDGKPIALGYHTGHWEISLQVEAAARELRRLGTIPFAGFCSDPCDGRTQGTPGMFDSLPYRNDAAILFRRLARSLPRRSGVLGVATCDKGLPAMMMAVAGLGNLPGVIVPGGVTLPAVGAEMPARSKHWARDLRTGWCPCQKPQNSAAARAGRLAVDASSSARRRLPKSSAKHWGSPFHTRRWRRPVNRCGWNWRGLQHGPCTGWTKPRSPRGRCLPKRASRTRWSSTPRLAAPPTCSCTSQPSPTPPGSDARRWRTGSP